MVNVKWYFQILLINKITEHYDDLSTNFIFLDTKTALSLKCRYFSRYVNLRKPSYTPPPSFFGPVWSLLYFMIATAGFAVWTKTGFLQQVCKLTYLIHFRTCSLLYLSQFCPLVSKKHIIIFFINLESETIR